LIVPNIIERYNEKDNFILDLSDVKEFQENGSYIKDGFINPKLFQDKKISVELYNRFINERVEKIFNNEPFLGVFSMGKTLYDMTEKGISEIGEKSAMIFPNRGRIDTIITHEVLHCMGLVHTFKSTDDENMKKDVIQFLANTDQFFLNIMMATGKSIVDSARKNTKGTIVTTMTRNGKDFGIRISGLGDEWFTAPVNTPKGLFFTGFTQDDANPDIGDSAITETVGVGGMTMIAAPGVTRFVGAGGFKDALKISDEMAEICTIHNPNFAIPTWDFKGAPLGIDIRKIVETGITPIINTGIAHKNAGVGQVGAGTVRAPLACFEKALIAYAKHIGLDTE